MYLRSFICLERSTFSGIPYFWLLACLCPLVIPGSLLLYVPGKEIDPLLNYSAGPMGTSEAKQGDTDTQHFCHLKKSVGENCHKSQESQRPCVSPIRIKINLQDSDEDDLVIDVSPVMPTSKKSRPFRGFKYQTIDERVHIMPLEERNLQISGTEEERVDKTQLAVQIADDGSRLEPPKSLTNTSLDIKSNKHVWC